MYTTCMTGSISVASVANTDVGDVGRPPLKAVRCGAELRHVDPVP